MMAKSGKKLQELNHYNFLSKKLWYFKTKNVLTDLTLICCDGQIRVHKAVLAKVIRVAGVDIQAEGLDLECLILPDVAVAEVESALEMLYLNANAEKFFSLVFLNQVKSEAFDDTAEADELETKLEISDDYYPEYDPIEEQQFEKCSLNENIKAEKNVSESEQDIEKYSEHKEYNSEVEKKPKKGRGRPKGCTDKTKRETYTFECKVCEKDIKGRLAYKKHMRKFHGLAEKKSVEINVKTQCEVKMSPVKTRKI